MEMKKKKTLLGILAIVGILSITIGVSVAFFNYTRTGAANTVSVGRISFVTRQTKTISLNNLFPIDPTDTEAMADATKVGTLEIEIEGDTDYVDGVEYLVSSVNSSITTSTGKVVPISLDVAVTNLGTSSNNYFTAREDKNATIYKKLVGDTLVGDQMLLVGYIKPNTTSGTAEGISNGKLTIKAYLDKNKILISDTYDGTESDNMGTPNSMAQGKTVLTTTEWNAFSSTGISFQVKVEANEGIWVKGSLEEMMKTENLNPTTNQPIMDNVASEFVSASTGVDFSTTSSSTNGKGVYMRAGTENDANPILYYRGAVENNNVLFANQCWKAVRTTETGGVKLIYNGTPAEVFEKVALEESSYTIVTNTDSKFTYNSTDSTWTANSVNEQIEISFKVPAGENYEFNLIGQLGQPSGTSAGGSFTIYKNGNSVNGGGGNYGAELGKVHNFGTLTADDVIKFTFAGSGFSSEYPNTFKIKMTQRGESLGSGCENSDTDTQITLSGTNTFPFSGTNLYKSLAYNGYMWGEVYEWTNAATTSGAYYGTGFTWDGTNYTLTSAKVGYDGTHHYTCNLTTAEGTCSSIRYYYYVSGTSNNYYITLTGGDSVEKAIEKMQTNTTPSNAKTQIESWYASNMTSYTNQLEDTIWCNDRTISTKAGWDPTGNVAYGTLYYAGYDRYYTNHSPSLACTNKNDSFTWQNANGNQKLNYPVAMLTIDEMVLAGGSGSTGTFYLNSGSNYYWSLSPSNFFNDYAREFFVRSGLIDYSAVDNSVGLRPAVSLKPGTPVVNGDGTATSPYRIGS